MIVYCARVRFVQGDERMFHPSIRPSKTKCKNAVENYNANSRRTPVEILEIVKCELLEVEDVQAV